MASILNGIIGKGFHIPMWTIPFEDVLGVNHTVENRLAPSDTVFLSLGI